MLVLLLKIAKKIIEFVTIFSQRLAKPSIKERACTKKKRNEECMKIMPVQSGRIFFDVLVLSASLPLRWTRAVACSGMWVLQSGSVILRMSRLN